MSDDVIKISGKETGPVSIVIAGVHGDETCGIEAFKSLLSNLTIKRGLVYFALGNPRAIKQGKRFTEANLNRMFLDDNELDGKSKSSYEYNRSKYLKKYLDKAQVLLDIHASSIPGSRSFLICEPNSFEIVKYLPTGLVVTGFDNVEPGGTDYYMNKQGKIGICLEAGYTNDSQSTVVAKETIMAFLKARNHLYNDLHPISQTRISMFDKYYSKTDKFVLAEPFLNFEALKSGQLIGYDGQTEVRAPRDCVILFAQSTRKVNEEAFLLGEIEKASSDH